MTTAPRSSAAPPQGTAATPGTAGATNPAPWYRRLFGRSLGWSLGLPAVLLVLQIFGSTGAAHRPGGAPGEGGLDWFAYLLLAAGPVLLTVRERWPVPVMLGVGAISLVYVLRAYPMGPFIFSLIVAVVCAVKARHRVIAWATFLGVLLLHFGFQFATGDPPGTTQLGAVTGWTLVVLVSAEVIRGVSERREVRARAREAEEASRITEERLRIARELHDVVSHNISLINVQAGTALHLIDRQPEQARTALATIKQSSKDALVELRSILGVLRQADTDELGGPQQPAPGLARLPSLVENARAAGLEVDRRTDDVGTLPDRVDLSAYRILQEAITNVIRHAHASRAEIALELGSAALELRVTDDGTGGSSAAGGDHGGSGLTGMRERAETLGGSLRAGPRADGAGFEVSATLPLPADRPPSDGPRSGDAADEPTGDAADEPRTEGER